MTQHLARIHGHRMAQGAEGSIASASPQTSVCIGNLKRDVDKEALAQMAAKLGRVANFRLHAPSGPGHDPDSPATAVVEYSSAEEAARAASNVHGRLILGQAVSAWVAAPGAAAQPLPAGTGSPQAAPKATTAAGGGGGAATAAGAAAGGRAAYPGGADHMNTDPNHDRKGAGGPAYTRYPPPAVPLSRVSSHEDPRNPRPSGPARGPGPPESHEDPRGAHPSAVAAWERAPPPQNQRVPERSPPQAEFAEAYPPSQQHLQQQHLQRQQSWSAGRPRGENGASAAAAAASRYVDEGDPDPYGPGTRQQQQQQQRQQWYRRQSYDDDEAEAWEQPGRDHYPPARRAAVAAAAGRPEHPSAYLQYDPSSRQHDEVEPHAGGPRTGYGGVVDGGGGQRRLPNGPSPRGGPPRGYADMPPHELRGDSSYDDGDVDEDVPGGKRQRLIRPSLARSSSRGGTPAGGRAAWGEDAGYALPPAPSIRGEDFEKEVVKAAALLVAEREMRAREAARKEETRDWPEEADPPRRYEDRQVIPRTHRAPAAHGAPAHDAAVHGGAPVRDSVEGHRRPLSMEGVERCRQRNANSRNRLGRNSRNDGRGRDGYGGGGGRDSSGRGGSGGAADRGSWKDGAAEEAWSGNKRARGDASPAGRGGSGRGEDRQVSKGRGEGKGEGRRTSDEKRAADEPKTKPPTRRAESRERHLAEGRDRHRDDSKGKYRNETRAKPDGRPISGSGNKNKERHPPSLRVSQPATEWERNGNRSDFQAEDGRRPWHAGDSGSARDGYGDDSGNGRGDNGYFVHVGGISFSTTFTTLAKRFAAFGDVNGFKVIFNNVTCRSADIRGGDVGGSGGDRSNRHDRRGGAKEEASKAAVVTASTGFAFISFEDERGMDKAIAGMNDQMLDGHVLKVSRGRMSGKFSVQHYRPYPELDSPSNFSGSSRPANKWSAPKGRSEYGPHHPYQKQHHQPNLQHYRPPERGDRRAAPVSPAASAAAASIVAAAATSSSSSALASARRSSGGGAAATAAAAADKVKDTDRRDEGPNGKRGRHSGPRERKHGDVPGATDQRDGGSGGRTIKTEKDSSGGDSKDSSKGSAKVQKGIQEAARSPTTSTRSTRTEKRPTIRMTSGLTRPDSKTT